MEFNSPMAKQFNGPVIDSLLNARHNIFNESEEFMLHRQELTLENATTEELNLIGKFLCMARPYAMVDGEPEYCDDAFYRIYIQNLAILRQSQSIYDLARMFDQFMPDGRYFVSFQPNGDLLVVLDEQYIAYTPFFQKALDSVFTALPRINTLTSWDFDKFVYDHRLYTRLISLVNSDWEFGVLEILPTYEYLLVGGGGTSAKVVTSDDSVEWSSPISISGVNSSFNDVLYAQEQWVAVSFDSVWVSPDRLSWTKTATVFNGGSYRLQQCLYGGGKYLVRQENGHLYVSEDLVNFSSVAGYFSFNSVIAFVEGLWFSVGNEGSPQQPVIRISSDAINWSAHTLPHDSGASIWLPRVVIYHDNTWYITNADLGYWTSSDLESFEYHQVTDTTISGRGFWSGTYADGKYVFGDRMTSTPVIVVSEDLIHWNIVFSHPGSIRGEMRDIMHVGRKWLAVMTTDSNESDGAVLSSDNLVDWQTTTMSRSSFWISALAVKEKIEGIGMRATVVSPSGKLTVTNHKATATIERRT